MSVSVSNRFDPSSQINWRNQIYLCERLQKPQGDGLKPKKCSLLFSHITIGSKFQATFDWIKCCRSWASWPICQNNPPSEQTSEVEDRDSGLQPRPRVGGGVRVHHRARLPQGEGNRTRSPRQERLVYQVTAPRLLSSIFARYLLV